MKSITCHVLRRLADGDFHSGEVLARSLGLSRGSVWLAVREIGAAGLEVYRVRGRGYRLAQPLTLLEREAVLRQLGADAAHFDIEILDSVSSTNTLAMQRAQQGAPSALVVAAELQEDGRGRMGRTWHSGVGGALTFSLL